MIKCFLSHSSKDKESYVRIVAARLRKEVRVFDEETFEKGMKTIDEITHGLDESSLFVIFLSESALSSPWVQNELAGAKSRFDDATLSRIYPIIIDPEVRFEDPRIPAWMKESLNIQPILKPSVAARKINARLIELSWSNHPRLRERRELFVGRNNLMEVVEERLDDFTREAPICLIASGLPSIGRRTFLQRALKKANLARESYEFPVVSLASLDSIEDFLLKIEDLGISQVELPNLTTLTVEEKIGIAKTIAISLSKERERVLIEDHGVIVIRTGEIVDWFAEVVKALSATGHLTFCIASQFRTNASLNRTFPEVFSVAVPELDIPERNGLLSRYARFHGLDLRREDLSFFSDLLTGYPEQALFAIDLIKEEGIFEAKRNSHTIQQYGSDKAQVILERYKDRRLELNLIYLLCRFEFISYDVLFDIVPEDEYRPVLGNLIASSICERLGASSEYIRVNEVIRDYVSRSRFGQSTEFDDSIQRHVKQFVEGYQDEHRDISNYIFSAQEALRAGNRLPDDLIVPSVFIKTIKQIYDEERNYSDAVALADRVLAKERFLHISTVNHVRFILCQSLARLRSHRFFDEIRRIPEPDRWFLYGFYYRLSGDYAKAEENLLRVLSERKRNDPRAVGELVLVYMQSDEFAKATELAKDNYLNRPNNPINANSYFSCLITKKPSVENRQTLEGIVARLRFDPSDRAQEMVDSMEAKIAAYYDNDEARSLTMINRAISRHSDLVYPLLTKADLALHFENAEALREAVNALARVTGPNAQSYRSFIKFKALLLAMDRKPDDARKLIRKELSGLIPSALERLNERVDSLANH